MSPGSDVVEDALQDAAISAVNLSEVVAKLTDAQWSDVEIDEGLLGLRLDVLPFDGETAIAAGRLRRLSSSDGLSLAERACLATSVLTESNIITADRTWQDLNLRGVRIECIR